MKNRIIYILLLLLGVITNVSFGQDTAHHIFKIKKELFATFAGKLNGTISRQVLIDTQKIVIHGCEDCKISGFELRGNKYPKIARRTVEAIKKTYNIKTTLLKTDTIFYPLLIRLDTDHGLSSWPAFEVDKHVEPQTRHIIIDTVYRYHGNLINPNDSVNCWADIKAVKSLDTMTGNYTMDTVIIFPPDRYRFESSNAFFTFDMLKAINNQMEVSLNYIELCNITIVTKEGEEKTLNEIHLKIE